MADQIPISQEYSDLVTFLGKNIADELLVLEHIPAGIELPQNQCYQVVDEAHVGIPKKVIAKAFLTAHHIFFKYLDDIENHVEDLLDASMIILLQDPEHLTAANVRKRIGLILHKRSKDVFEQHIRNEVWFNDFLVMSKLKRHNKSPTLWAHRKWLIKNFADIIDESPSKRTLAAHELDEVVYQSADRHPRNYYAWDYLRWFIAWRPSMGNSIIPLEEIRAMDFDADSAMTATELDERNMVHLMLGWCFEHTSDISGWEFLMHLHRRRYYMSVKGVHLQAWCGQAVLQKAVNYGLKNESIWTFLGEMAKRKGQMLPSMQKFCSDYERQLEKFRVKEKEGTWIREFADKEKERLRKEAYAEYYQDVMDMMS